MKPEDQLQSILDSLPPEERTAYIIKLQAALNPTKKKVKISKEEYRDIIHNYHCEMCDEVKRHSYPVKIKSADGAIRGTDKPLKLYYVCDECKKIFVVGMALAIQIIKERKII